MNFNKEEAAEYIISLINPSWWYDSNVLERFLIDYPDYSDNDDWVEDVWYERFGGEHESALCEYIMEMVKNHSRKVPTKKTKFAIQP